MKKALVVGLDQYSAENELHWCSNDTTTMGRLLESNGDGSPNFDVIQIIDECDRIKLSNAIDKLFADDAEIALLYFSGHGTDKDGGYLVTTDCTEHNVGVQMTYILDCVNASKCKNRIIILDCCFAAKMGETFLTENQSVLGNGVTIMAASQSWQSSVEDANIQHGIFTDLLIQGLQGGAADISGSITPASLYAFVDQSLGP